MFLNDNETQPGGNSTSNFVFSVDESSSRRRVTFNQLEVLWEVLNSHKEIAVGYNKSAQARKYAKRMWELIAETLNSQGEGAIKTPKGWSNYWTDYKAKLKKRVAAIRLSSTRTGGGAPDVSPLNDIEKKFLEVLGDNFGAGLPNTQVPLFPTLPQPSTSEENDRAIQPILEIAPTEERLQSAPPLEIQPQPLQSQCQPQPQYQSPPQPQYQSPPQPQSSSSSRPMRRRRRRAEGHITQDEARRTFVEISRLRLEQDRRNSETWEQMVAELKRLNNTVERLLQTLPAPR